jgi:predicted DNA-binding WGR domain protein
MSGVRWDRAPRGLDGGGVRVENLALVPASLLPHKATYQRLANQLPPGAVLVVLPDEDTPERQVLQQAAARFLAKGHPVTTLTAAEVLAPGPRRRPAARSTPRREPIAPTPSAAPAPPPLLVVQPAADLPAPEAVAVPPFTRELRLVSLDDSRNRARFYLLQWQPTLWEGVALVRVWGRIGAGGRAQVVCYAAAATVDATVHQLVRRRLRHGYQIVDWH